MEKARILKRKLQQVATEDKLNSETQMAFDSTLAVSSFHYLFHYPL